MVRLQRGTCCISCPLCLRDALKRDRQEHNLDLVAFKSVPKNTSTTLEYFVRNYVDHLVHHLNQILVARPAN